MQLLNQIQTILMLTIVLIGLFSVIIFLVYFFYRKKNGEVDGKYDMARTAEVYDSSGFLPIEDIRNGMIIDDDGQRFTAAILCSGSDFYSDNIDEKVRKQKAYISFWHTVREDICYRQSPEDINLGHTIEKYRNAYGRIEMQLFSVNEEYEKRREVYDRARRSGQTPDPAFEDMLIKLQEKQKHLSWRLKHIQDEIALCESMSGNSTENEKKQKAYIFSWHDAGGIRGTGLKKDQLEDMASRELEAKASRMIHMLSSAGVTAKRATTADLIDLVRRTTHPYTGNLFSYAEMEKNSVVDGDFIRTDSFRKLKDEYRKEVIERTVFGNGSL